ncbi:hypothetical protein AMTRI_Chr05g65200 [Amborella trichopoda]
MLWCLVPMVPGRLPSSICMLWETLTGREHLLLFGRLRTSKAVEKSLKSLNLYNGGVGDKLTAQYSGGIKRRLSVAISLIGDPQKRNMRTNLGLMAFPIFLCFIIIITPAVVSHQLDKPKYKCGCQCVDTREDGSCGNVCGVQYSTLDQVSYFAIPNPQKWPALLQVPSPKF